VLARRLFRLVTVLVVVTTTWLVYDNVLSDVEPTRALAEAAACRVKDCKKRHGMTKMSRSPAGQAFEFSWEDGVVSVSCRRESFVFGAMRCEAP
jgi:hypothetical protein